MGTSSKSISVSLPTTTQLSSILSTPTSTQLSSILSTPTTTTTMSSSGNGYIQKYSLLAVMITMFLIY